MILFKNEDIHPKALKSQTRLNGGGGRLPKNGRGRLSEQGRLPASVGMFKKNGGFLLETEESMKYLIASEHAQFLFSISIYQ